MTQQRRIRTCMYYFEREGLTYKRLLQTHFNDKGFISVKKNGKWSIKMEDVFDSYSTKEEIQLFIKTNIQLYVKGEHLNKKHITEDEATLTNEQKKWVDKFKKKEDGESEYLSIELKKKSERKAARGQNLESNRAKNKIAKVTRKTTGKPKAKRKLKLVL